MRTLDEQLAAGATPARNRLDWFKTSLIGLAGSDVRVDRWFDGVWLECQSESLPFDGWQSMSKLGGPCREGSKFQVRLIFMFFINVLRGARPVMEIHGI